MFKPKTTQDRRKKIQILSWDINWKIPSTFKFLVGLEEWLIDWYSISKERFFISSEWEPIKLKWIHNVCFKRWNKGKKVI